MSKHIVFMMGIPGSGKTTAIGTQYPDMQVLSCDDLKKEHPDYHPDRPSGKHNCIHIWSKALLNLRYHRWLAEERSFVYDGTGCSPEAMPWLKKALKLGYTVELCYVPCTLEVCLGRNAVRKRKVPEYVLHMYAETVEEKFEEMAALVHTVRVIK